VRDSVYRSEEWPAWWRRVERANKPRMNLLAPAARPLFTWNHDVVMDWGAGGLARKLGVERLD
jgi:hypothetical protein